MTYELDSVSFNQFCKVCTRTTLITAIRLQSKLVQLFPIAAINSCIPDQKRVNHCLPLTHSRCPTQDLRNRTAKNVYERRSLKSNKERHTPRPDRAEEHANLI